MQLAKGMLVFLQLGSAMGIGLGIILRLVQGPFALWTADLPWAPPAIRVLLACTLVSLPAARRAGVPWTTLKSPLLNGAMLAFSGAVALPMFWTLANEDGSQMLPPMAPMLAVLLVMAGAALIGLGPALLSVQRLVAARNK